MGDEKENNMYIAHMIYTCGLLASGCDPKKHKDIVCTGRSKTRIYIHDGYKPVPIGARRKSHTSVMIDTGANAEKSFAKIVEEIARIIIENEKES